jgi:endonuclease VIII
MPEGDTIHRTAAALRRALAGRTLTRVELARVPPPLPAVGACIERVEARGKHLLIRSSDALTVHTHLRMSGSWHLYRPGEPWQRSARAARVVLGVPGVVAACFAAPVVEVLDDAGMRRHPSLAALGPDLCDPNGDVDDAVARMGRLVSAELTIGEALLDQRVACGIGNVYRCEVLFLHGLDPTTPVPEVEEPTRRSLLATAGALLRDNLEGGARTTTGGPSGSLWVYGRAGRPCRRCGTTIVRDRLGEQARVVDRCPSCQARPVSGEGTAQP